MMPLGPVAWPLALLYGAGSALFRRSYEMGLRPRERFSLPVISVGNIEVGGTGKSPLVAALCRHLLRAGVRPGVVSRGYGRSHPGKICLVSRGEGLLVPVEKAGDEPALLVRTLPAVSVAVASDRREGIRLLEGLCDLVILDDGFQSLEVLPTCSLVFLPETLFWRPMGVRDLLPAGSLRELPAALTRATHWIVRRPETPSGDVAEREDLLRKNLRTMLGPDGMRPILSVSYKLSRLQSFDGVGIGPVETLSGRKVAVVAGIANPGRVVQALESLGAQVVGILVLPDHTPFTSKVQGAIANLSRSMASQGAELLLTTEKDRIKWTHCPESPIPVLVLEGETRLLDIEAWNEILALPRQGNEP